MPRLRWLENQWHRLTPWHILLAPAGILFRLLVALRAALYRSGWLPSARLPVTVIVVGNISVGGTGKTPLVLWLAEFLQQHGFRPGIISRGYRGSATGVQPVLPGTSPDVAGDEAVLLAGRSGCPIWVGRDRVAAARALLAAHPECNLLISDDGLQHYRLKRDVEIAVVDGERRFGNGLLLPAGPLRESIRRLNHVDAVVINGPASGLEKTWTGRALGMQLRGDTFYNLSNPEQRATAAELRNKKLHAIAGIGNPPRFFAHLRRLGLDFIPHAFPDHHGYRPEDLAFENADAILMTEKDAVKCLKFAEANCWVLPVDAEPDPALGDRILSKLRKAHGSQAA